MAANGSIKLTKTTKRSSVQDLFVLKDESPRSGRIVSVRANPRMPGGSLLRSAGTVDKKICHRI